PGQTACNPRRWSSACRRRADSRAERPVAVRATPTDARRTSSVCGCLSVHAHMRARVQAHTETHTELRARTQQPHAKKLRLPQGGGKTRRETRVEGEIIERVSAERAREVLGDLVRLLQDAVADGASIGFLAPLSDEEAGAYWRGVADDIASGSRVLLLAWTAPGAAAGSVQLELAARPNATHRAEVQKLMVL